MRTPGPWLNATPNPEAARLAALAACGAMHTPRERAFDNLVFTAAQLFRAPVALLNLVHADHAWAKAAVGMAGNTWDRRETFCNAVIETGMALVVEDAALDRRFMSLAIVARQPSMRFYAGAPIQGPGRHVIGALCVMDRSPRMVPEHKRRQLRQLATEAGNLLAPVAATDADWRPAQ